MSQVKNKKGASPWFQCENCLTNLIHKDIEIHENDCPPNLKTPQYGFVKDGVLYGHLDVKVNEEIKNVDSKGKDFLVFLSQGAIQLTNLSIGDWCKVESLDDGMAPLAKIVWPTVEKTLTSVLMTKNSIDLNLVDAKNLVVSKLECNKVASLVTIVVLNGPKSLEITQELNNRISKSHIGKILRKNNSISIMYYGKVVRFEIKDISGAINGDICDEMGNLSLNDDFYMITEKTKWKLFKDKLEFKKSVDKVNLLDKIAGLTDEISEIKSTINACFNTKSKGIKCKSILLYGNSGTGKTVLANAIAQDTKVNIVNICAPDLYSKYSGNIEEVIKELFQSAIDNSPSIVVLDEVDILCPIRSNRVTDTEKRIVSSLLMMFDKLKEEDAKVFVVATTNKPDNIDPSFRRFGRLDREIEISTPNPKNRKDILQKILQDFQVNLTEEELYDLSLNTHGFVGADLVSFCSRASLNAIKRNDENLKYEDFKYALTKVRPSAMREVQIEVPNIKWQDIGGQDNLKLILRQAVEWPLKHAASFLRLGVTPPKGVLMYGPPGCSKTMIAKALATESGLNFLSIKGPELFSKWVGESERAVREVFRKARQVAPSIIFFDEIDALGGERSTNSSTSVQERVLAQLLTELDGVEALGDVTVLAATNRPDRIDKALLRPGRLDRIVYVPLPDENTRKEIFRIKLSKMPVVGVSTEDLVSLTKGYSGAEVNAVCHEAAMMALEESLDIEHVEKRHFDKALDLIKPRTPPSLIKLYDDYAKLKE